MINLKDEKDVQIWCDYQEEAQQTSADYFLRFRFSNFRTFSPINHNPSNSYVMGDVPNYGYGYGNKRGNGYGCGCGCGFGLSNGDGNGYGGNNYGNGFGYGWGDSLGDGYGNSFGNNYDGIVS